MENHYFIEEALRSLTPHEHRRFEIFLKSDYNKIEHTSISAAYLFYKPLKKVLRNKVISDEEYKEIVIDIYPGIKYKNSAIKKKLIKLKSDLLKYFNNFIVIEKLLNEKPDYFLFLFSELEKRKLRDIFEHLLTWKRYPVQSHLKEPEYSFFEWKTCHLANKHREHFPRDKEPRYKVEKTDKGIDYTRIISTAEDRWLDTPGYFHEKMLLKGCFKNQLRELEKREQQYNKKKRGGGKKRPALLKQTLLNAFIR